MALLRTSLLPNGVLVWPDAAQKKERKPVVVTQKKCPDYNENKSANLYRLIFQLPPDENVTVTVMQGDMVQSKSVMNPVR